MAESKRSLQETETRLLEAVKVQATTASSAAKDLQAAKSAVAQLHGRVSDIRGKAEASETVVASICDAIRHLDTAKANLSTSIKALRDLQLYIIAIQSLSAAFEARDFARCNDALRSAQGYRAKFKPLEDAPKIKELGEKLGALERQLEFHLRNSTIGEMRPGQGGGMSEEQLREACLVVDALGPDVQARVRGKFVATQLEAYGTLFRRGTEDAVLERTERRFAFIRKLLESNERFFLHVFPRHWCVAQELCLEFCLRTHKELAHQLREEAGSLDVAVLVFVLQRTIEAEKDLTQRMRHLQAELDDDDDNLEFEPVASAAATRAPLPEYRYYGMIVSCFDAHMGQFVQHEDRMLERTVADNVAADTIAEDQLTLQSSQDLFLFIQESKRRAATFAQPNTLADLANVWLKHLVRYAELVREKIHSLSAGPGATGGPSPTSSTAGGNAAAAATDEQLAFLCAVVNSADYCRGAAEGLAEDLTKLLDGDIETLRHLFEEVPDAFVALSSAANARIVDALCHRLGQHVGELQTYLAQLGASNDHAHSHSDALDESPASVAMRQTYRDAVMLFARSLHPSCFPYLLNKTAATFVPKHWARAIYNPKTRHSDLTISQLRIDCNALERWLVAIPNDIVDGGSGGATGGSGAGASGSAGGGYGSAGRLQHHGVASAVGSNVAAASVLGVRQSGASDAPRVVLTAYGRTVKREVGYLAAALKVLQLPAGDAFVDLYYSVTAPERRSLADCGRLLELKGVKADDTRQLLALLRRHADVPREDAGSTLEPASRANMAASSSAAAAGGSPGKPASRQHSDPHAGGAAAAADDDDDGPGAALRRKFREMSIGTNFMTRLKRTSQGPPGQNGAAGGGQ